MTSVRARLAAFALVLATAFGAAYGVGAATADRGPADPEPVPHEHGDPGS